MSGEATPQGDLFSLDSPLLAEVRGERSLMAFPFFALSKGKWTKPLSYRTEQVSIEILATPKGVATIYDKEVLLYIASIMVAKLEAGAQVSQDFYFTAHDLFRVTGISGSARSYERLSDALERLQGTQIKTNIEAGGEGASGYFSWLSEAQLHYSTTRKGERRLKAVKVRLCDWLYRAILRDREVLDYSSAYFQLGPVERRLYEVARSACGRDPITVDIEELRLQLGYQSSLKHFRFELKRIADAGTIPDFSLDLEDVATSQGVIRQRRNAGASRVRITPRPSTVVHAEDVQSTES